MKIFRQLAVILLLIVSLFTAANVSAIPQDDIAHYTKQIQQNPNDADAYNNRAIAYALLEKYERAVQDFSKVIRLKPNDAKAYYNRGVAYGKLGQTERELADYSKAIELKPDYSDAYGNRGNSYVKLKQYERAIQDFNKVIALKPNAMAYTNRGVAHSLMGGAENVRKAIADCNKAIELNPNYAPAYKMRGLCYQALGDEAKAQADFAKAKELGYKG